VSTTSRVLALLEILQAGGTRTVADLADRLGVDQRTVRRYIDHLVDLDVPVRSVRGRYGGYRLAPGYKMPPLMLTGEEALAVLLGLSAGRVSTSVAAESAAAKVRRVLPEPLGRRLDALLATADFTAAARPVVVPDSEVLLTLAEAVRARRPTSIAYTSFGGRRSERVVHPYGIVAHSGRWYLSGADALRGEVRTFRLDRIGSVVVGGAGEFEVPAGFDAAETVLSGMVEVPRGQEVSVRVRGSVDEVRGRFAAGIASVAALDDEWVRVRLRAVELDWVPGVLAGLGRPFVIEYPEALRGAVRALASRLVAAADAAAGSDEESPACRARAPEGPASGEARRLPDTPVAHA